MLTNLFRSFRTTKARRRSVRLAVEGLEDRWLMNAVGWIGGGGDNDFSNPANWRDAGTGMNHVPGPLDDATISVQFAGITVSVNESQEVGTIGSVPTMHVRGGTFVINGQGVRDSSLNGLVLEQDTRLEVHARRLQLTTGGNIFGFLDAEVNGSIEFRNGVWDVSATAAFEGLGQYSNSGAVVIILADKETPVTDAPVHWAQVGGTLAVASEQTFRVVGSNSSTFLWTGGAISGPGRVVVEDGATLTLSDGSGKELDGGVTLTSAGTGTWTGTGAFVIRNGSVFENAGTFTVTNRDTTVVAFGVINNTGAWIQNSVANSVVTHIRSVFNNLGTVQLNQGILSLEGGSNSTGTFNAEAGTQLLFAQGAHTLDPGSVLTSDGLVRVTSGGSLGVHGIVSAMNLDVLNGTLGIGSNGILNIAGDYLQQSTGNLVIALGGTTPGEGYGQLNVAGTANLAGILTVVYADLFLPSVGDSFTLLTFGALNGSFSQVRLPGLPPGRHWENNGYADGSFTLLVIAD